MTVDALLSRTAAVALLARGMSTDATGAEIGVNGRTVRRWRDEPEFMAEVEAARRTVLDESIGAVTTAVRKAIETLYRALDDENALVRVRAASELIRSLPLLATHADLDARIAALEARAAAEEGTR